MQTPETFLQRLRQGAENRPELLVLVFVDGDGREQRITYRQLYADAMDYAAWLQHEAIAPGTVVLLAFDHGYELVQAFFGACYAGMLPLIYPYVSTHLSTTIYGQGLAMACAELGVGAVLTSTAYTAALSLRLGVACIPVRSWPGGDTPEHRLPDPVDDTEWAYLQLSSGTSGVPKAIIVGHGALTSYLDAVHLAFSMQAGDVSLTWVPLFHDMGMASLLSAVQWGTQTIFMPPEAFIRQPAAYLQALSDFGVTLSWMPNFGFAHILRRVEPARLRGIDLHALRLFVNGAEPVLSETVDGIQRFLTPVGLKPGVVVAGYGLAECVTVVTVGRAGRNVRVDRISAEHLQSEQRAVPVSDASEIPAVDLVGCGQPLSAVEVAILDEAGRPLVERQVGQIGVRGSTLFSGYYRQPDLTARAFHGDWLLTGDLGYIAGEELFVCGRIKDLIISGGANLHPEMIEQVVLDTVASHVRRIAAFGVQDSSLGSQTPVVVLELRKELMPAELNVLYSTIRRHVRAALGVQLGDVRIVPAGWIGSTTSGKTMRGAARKRYLAAGFHPEFSGLTLLRVAGDDPVLLEQALTTLVGEMLGLDTVTPNDSFFVLGGDSLTALRFLLAVEDATGRRVPPEFFREPTVAHLVGILTGTASPDNRDQPYDARRSFWGRAIQLPRLALRRLRSDLILRGPVWRGRGVPYEWGVQVQRRFCSNNIVQHWFFARSRAVFHAWLEATRQANEESVLLTRHLMANTWQQWRQAALSAPEQWAKFVALSGTELLDRDRRQGRGIVFILPHYADLTWIERVITRYEPDLDVLRGAGLYATDEERLRLHAERLVNAHRVLARGGAVLIAIDSVHGRRGVEVPFYGYRMPFRSGAAELAASTGASLVFITWLLGADGRMTIDFGKLSGSQGGSYEETVTELLNQYAARMTTAWPTLLPSLGSGALYSNTVALQRVDAQSASPPISAPDGTGGSEPIGRAR